jgi:hypothetical protein
MHVLKGINLGIAFLLELAMLGGITFAAFLLFDSMILGLLLSFMALMGTMVIWAVFASPRAIQPLPRPQRIVLKSALFLISGLGLIAVGYELWGIALIVAFAIHEILAVAWGQERVSTEPPPRRVR